jgi:mercuric reductase
VRYDLAIIGSGGAAFAAAITAIGAGARVVMVERGQVGGTCVNTGCVPSKALLAAAEARHVAATQSFPGIATTAAGAVDPARLLAGKDALVAALRADKYVDVAADYGWEIMSGTASFTAGPALDVALTEGGARRIEADRYLIATGSAPWAPPIPGLTQTGYLTSTTALELAEIPESLLVLGAGAVGLELAQLFARLGARVTIVEALDRVAPVEEPEISAALTGVLVDEGIAVHTAATAVGVTRDTDGYALILAGAGQRGELGAQRLLVATGRYPVTAGLNLEAVGVSTGERGAIVIDEQQRTNNSRIWAAGDVTGGPQYVYAAAAQGSLAAENALAGTGRSLDYTALPRVTFTTPQAASVGLTDAQAVTAGLACDCRVLPLAYVPRALVNRDTRGLLKIVAEAGTGRLLGVHALADGAGDLITAAGYALSAGWTVTQLARHWAPYLTMAEALKLAAQAFTRDVTKLSCCAA